MIINSNILHIPPFISTSWKSVASIHMNGTSLVIVLTLGHSVSIPNLQSGTIEQIFGMFSSYMEKGVTQEKIQNPLAQALLNANEIGSDSPFRFGFSPMDGIGSALQHNQAQANSPDLPAEILDKIAAIAKIVSPDDQAALPKPEPHCNCMHCQIARAINSGAQSQREEEPEQTEPVVNDDELNFQTWEIQQTGNQMYTVTNKIDSLEKYTVYLGNPVGCTCGNSGCEHILAVLKS